MAAASSAESHHPSAPIAGRVFLSYAPADEAEAARIAAALRKHEVEVSAFHPAGQRGTPEWQARIEREIQGCDVFIPLISVQTESNSEGPFRTEWRVAADRAAAKTDALPFLLPLTLGPSSSGATRVPDVFRRSIWMAMPEDEEEAAVTARVQEALRQHDNARQRGGRGNAAPQWVSEPEPPPPPAPPGQGISPVWIVAALGIAAAIVGFFFLKSAPSATLAARSASTVAPSPTPKPVTRSASGRALDASRVFLPAFVNLAKDPALDAVGQTIAAEFTRALVSAAKFQVLLGTHGDLPAALEDADHAGAGIVVTGSLSRTGTDIRVHAQVTFVASGLSFGSLGPISLDPAITGPALAEMVERVTTGVCDANALLKDPPTSLVKVISTRNWARWPLAQQARARAALPAFDIAGRIKDAQTILHEDSAMLDVWLQLACAFRDAQRYDEADVIFGELFRKQALLSQAELFELLYHRSLLLSTLEPALAAARERSDLRPRSNAIDDMVACLLALNRPRTAATDLARWLEANRAQLPAPEIARRENEAAALEILAFVRHGETAKAQARLAALKTKLAPATSLAALQLEALILARAGSQADFDRLVDRVGDLPAIPSIEGVRLAYILHCQLLQVGRNEEAAHFLDRAKRLWSARPGAAGFNSSDVDAILLEADLDLAQNRAGDALAVLDRAAPAIVMAAQLEFDGRRALALQDLGRTADFAPLLNKLESAELRNSWGLPLYWRARLAARAGLHKSAVELLRMAVGRGLWFSDPQHFATSYGRSEPEFAALHGQTAYDDLMRAAD